MGKFSPAGAIVFSNFILFQYMVFILLHLLAANYTNKIHHCTKELFHIEGSRPKLGFGFTPLTRLRMSLYIDKFNSTKRYGITYGPFGLMSFASFFKVCLLWGVFDRDREGGVPQPQGALGNVYRQIITNYMLAFKQIIFSYPGYFDSSGIFLKLPLI